MRRVDIKVGERCTAYGALFDTTTEFANYVKTGVSEATFKGITQGNDKLVPRSDALLERIETVEKLADAQPSTVRAVTGGVADVPAFLQGSPMAMRMRRRQEAKAPITICVDSITSGGCLPSLIERRGVAVLALVRKLETAGHAVTLYITGGMGPGSKTAFVAAKMDSGPIDLARACWIMSNASFQRQAMFTAGSMVCYGGTSKSQIINWPYKDHAWLKDLEGQQQAWGQLIGVEPSTVLVVPPVYMTENSKFGSDEAAAAWVNERYEQASALHEVAPW